VLAGVSPMRWAEGHAVAELQDWRGRGGGGGGGGDGSACDAAAPVVRRLLLRPSGECLAADARALAARFAGAVRAHAAQHASQQASAAASAVAMANFDGALLVRGASLGARALT
jgi:hypothetical protein